MKAKREYENRTLGRINTSQLQASNNAVSVVNELDDRPYVFVKSLGTNFANHPCDLCDPDPILLAETKRFARDVSYRPKRDE